MQKDPRPDIFNATLEKLPAAFLSRLQQIIPEADYVSCVESFIRPRATTFRVNSLKAGVDSLLSELRRQHVHPHPVAWFDHAFWIETREREKLMSTPQYEQGEIYVQNLSSMVPPIVLNPRPGEEVLDLTAAPGSKTVQMAAMMENEGQIIAVEVAKSRFYKLLNNMSVQGVLNTKALLTNGEFFWRKNAERFDRVLLDAPCSTEGRFHVDDPDSTKYWSERKIRDMVKKQNRLFFSALRCLKVGGTMVYSTCSFAPEENEGVLNRQLDKFGYAFEIERVRLPFRNVQRPLSAWGRKSFDERLAPARRILPTREMEAFFICRLRKTHSID